MTIRCNNKAPPDDYLELVALVGLGGDTEQHVEDARRPRHRRRRQVAETLQQVAHQRKVETRLGKQKRKQRQASLHVLRRGSTTKMGFPNIWQWCPEVVP